MSQKNFTNATGNWIVSDTGEISYSGKVKIEGDLQANDFLDANGNPFLKSVDEYKTTTSAPIHMVSWSTEDTYDGYSGVFNISWERKRYPDYNAAIRGNCLQGSEGIGIFSGDASVYSAQHATPFGLAVTVASKHAEFLTPEIILVGTGGSTSDANAAIKLKRDGASVFKNAVQAADFLDANGNSIVVDNSHTDANNNVSVGANALKDPSDGPNTAMGYSALSALTTGKFNTAFGYAAMSMRNEGEFNTAVGHQTMMAGQAGNHNTGVGTKACSNTRGDGNTGFGYWAASYNTDGNYNTAVGHSADMTQRALTNATAIGYDAKVNASNKIQLGNADVTRVHTYGAIQAADFLDANGNSIKFNSSNYYTTTESDAKYQPKGNYPQSTSVNNFVTMTQSQYDALSSKDANTIYFIKE